MSTANKLVLDIETIGEDFDALDHATQENLTRWIQRESESEEVYKLALEDLKNGLGFSPLTGEIVAIGMLDFYKNEGAVYYQAPGKKPEETKADGMTFKAMTEEEMLKKFWEVAKQYQVFITFNGRSFDIPFLVTRSAIHDIRPTKDLMRGRYLYQHQPDALHIDLLEQLTFYGASRKKGSLHLWCRAFGIESPKAAGVTGDDVAPLFKAKKYLDIARYNVGDLRATRALYERWEKYLSF
ncbi:MAG TPA: ribonuclease H-like domain-containing protein [Candidatus Paceibacterota bacterium]|nr:ribonuclease H-like domain-containing protein [Candidatus Paceibacterota bacterium]